MSSPRPFSAASNKLAYAQAFTQPTVRRSREHAGHHLRVPALRRRAVVRGRAKTSSAA
jgi:hypothetical protein